MDLADDATPENLWAALPDSTGRDRGDILIRLSHALGEGHDHSAAQTCAEEAVAVFAAAGAQREQAMAMVTVAYGKSMLGANEEAVSVLQEAKSLFDIHGEPRDLLPLYEALGHIARELGNWDESLQWFKALRDAVIAESPGPRDIATAELTLGTCYEDMGGADDLAIIHLTAAVEQGSGEHPAHWVMRARETLVYALLRQGRDQEALDGLNQNLAIARTCECGRCLPEALAAIAYAIAGPGNDAVSRDYLEQAAAEAKRHANGEPTRYDAHLLQDIGAEHDNFTAGMSLIADADAVYLAVGFPWGPYTTHAARAELCAKHGRHDEALAHRLTMAEQAPQYEGRRGQFESLRNLASAHLAASNPSAAIAALESNGWHIHQGPLTSKDRADHLVGYAEALAASGNPERSLAIAEQVITSCDGVAWPDLHGRAHRARARALRHREPGTAERAAQRAMAYLNVAGKFEESTEIGTEFFIQPYQSLTKIDIDNQARAEAEREQREQEAAIRARHERDIVAASVQSDPIEDQVSQPTGDAGAASA